jgi:hypothetical protein
MALTLSNSGISNSSTIEAAHISQSIDALTGAAAYDIKISGSLTLTGSVQSQNGFTGSLFGTSSFSTLASVSISSSIATSASYSINSDAAVTATSASYSLTTTSASFATTASFASTLSPSATVVSASYAVTASHALNIPAGSPRTAQSGSVVTGTTAETLGLALTISPNTFTTNDFIRFQARLLRTTAGAAGMTLKIYINTANTLNGSEVQIGSAAVGNTVRFATITRTLAIRSSTAGTEWSAGSTGDDPSQENVVASTSNFDWTSTLYALATITLTNTGDNAVISGIFLEKI